MRRISWTVCAVLLIEDAKRDGDDVAWEVAKRWVVDKDGDGEGDERQGWMERARWDRRIVFDAGDRMGLDNEKAKL